MTDKDLILSKERSVFFLSMLDMSAIQDISNWQVSTADASLAYIVLNILSVCRAVCGAAGLYSWHAVAMVVRLRMCRFVEPTHPDAELHIFSAVNFHAFV